MTLQFLTQNERNALLLEDLYSHFGYEKYKVKRFEEYGFYMENQSFLTDRRVLTFSGPNGKLMALKPDVTTSIVKNSRIRPEENHKIYYNESVFRIPKGGDEFREIHQTGVEFIGELDSYQTLEVLNLAVKSLETISPTYRLCLSNTALVLILFNKLQLKSQEKNSIIKLLTQKNSHDLAEFLKEHAIEDEGIFTELLNLPSDLEEGMAQLEQIFSSWEYEAQLQDFKTIVHLLGQVMDKNHLYLDFSHIPSTEYYNGLVFTGYLEGLAEPALTGGRYDNLLEKMGLYNQSALGFAVDLSATQVLFSHEKQEILNVEYSSQDSVTELIEKANQWYKEGTRFHFKH